jgi:hypothetical protein
VNSSESSRPTSLSVANDLSDFALASVRECPERQNTVIRNRLDFSRIAIATGVAGGLGVALAAAFSRHAQDTAHVGPTAATLDEAFSAFFGAGIGLALGSALCALTVRRGSPQFSGLLAGLAAYVLVLAPVWVYTDDVSLAEDLNPGGLVFLAILLLPFGVFAVLGATVGGLIASVLHRGRMQKPHQH